MKKLSLWLIGALMLVVPVSVAAQGPAQPEGSDPNWSAFYYGNRDLSGDPVLVRSEEVIRHNWETGSPDARVPSDGFSARWIRSVSVSAGTYRFSVTSDDGVRLWIDDTLVLDEWNDHAARTFFVDRYLDAGEHVIRVEFYEHTGLAVMQLSWFLTSRAGDEWQAQYYNNMNLEGLPVRVRSDAEISFDWDTSSPDPGVVDADTFSASWAREVDLSPGLYEFTVVTDDGARLWVDGELLIDAWYDQAATTYTATKDLPDRPVTIRMEYYEHTGYAVARLSWTPVETDITRPEVMVVDDTDANFVDRGEGEWLSSPSGGFGGRFAWTYNNQQYQSQPNQVGYNWGRWYPDAPRGDYAVYAYIPVQERLTTHARYSISHANGSTWRVVNQAQNQGRWVWLGVYEFRGDGSGSITLSDVTFEAPQTRIVAFDAVRLVRR